MILPNASIDKIVANLVQNGVTTLELPTSIAESNKRAFDIASCALDMLTEKKNNDDTNIPRIKQDSNSASATGYHSAGGQDSLSRYNTHRQGFIFSNGESFDISNLPLSHYHEDDHHDRKLSFEQAMNEMFDTLCNTIAKSTLQGIARYLELEDEDWFEQVYGPMESSSQWHVKRYVEPSIIEKNEVEGDDVSNHDVKEGEDAEIEWLPVHTDPSLISVIIHDAPGYNPNAMGLQYQCSISPQHQQQTNTNNNERKTKVWKEVEAHGHSVATIFCGSVMSYITGGLFPSAKHRVIYQKDIKMQGATPMKTASHRQAATLFLRPQGQSILTIPPCPTLLEGERTVRIRKELQFKDWLNRVSKNYQKKQKNTSQKIQKKKNADIQNNDIDDPIFWADEYTELTLHGANPSLNGKEKYLGGELCSINNHIYTIPGFAERIIDMDVTTDPPTLTLIGPKLKGEYKWLRGLPIDNIIYGIPCHSGHVLKINALTNNVELLSWDESLPGAPPLDQKWKYHGAAVSDFDGCIYCIPQAAEHVLKLDPLTDEITFIGSSFPGVNKWYGGLLLPDGCIYGVCQNASGILKINPRTQECTMHGNFPLGNYKWHGGVTHPNGNLYCIPAHANTVLKIEPCGMDEPKLTEIGNDLRTGQHRSDGKYKFLGGAVGGDYVYFFPSDADYVVEVNTKTDEVREVGPDLRDLEPMRHNKWQNGFTSVDGIVYGIPLKGHTVLRIIPPNVAGNNEEGAQPIITTIGGPYAGLNKWEGGVTADNGDMFCIPLNHKCTLRIRPLTN